MLAVNVALLAFGPYELSLVGIEGQRIANMTPPSLLLAGHAIMMCAFAIAAAPAIGRWARRPRVWWLAGDRQLRRDDAVPVAHARAAADAPGVRLARVCRRYPGQPNMVRAQHRFSWSIMVALVAVLFVALRPLENNPLPGGTARHVRRAGARGRAVGTAAVRRGCGRPWPR